MFIEFNQLPKSSKVWVYQCNRSFSENEIFEINKKITIFLDQWQAHGEPLESSFEIKYHRFIIIASNQDKQPASGCSIDAQVHFIQDLEKYYQVTLLDKMNVSYKQGEFIAYKSLTDFKAMVKNKSISKNTIVFNNIITNIGEYEEFWEVPAEESWHKRFF